MHPAIYQQPLTLSQTNRASSRQQFAACKSQWPDKAVELEKLTRLVDAVRRRHPLGFTHAAVATV
jgi:hypothetical protein